MITFDRLTNHRDEVRARLAESLFVSPRDFIRQPASFGKADRLYYIDQLTQDIAEADDLRFLARGDGLELAVFAQRLSWDSQFFGYEVARLDGMFSLLPYNPHQDYHEAVQHLLKQAQSRGIKYLFATVFPEDLATIRALTHNSFQLIETRAIYHRSLINYAYDKRFAARLATSADVASLAHIVKTMVNAYDRFHADPFISPVDADRMMEKWVDASINEGFADATIVPDVPEPKAFCTAKYHQDKWAIWGLKLSQPVLSAVGLEARGWYLKVISELSYHLKEIGAEHSYLTTQVTNRAVIRVWENLGYSYGRGEHIFRIIL